MPIEVSWYQESRIIHAVLKGTITVEDMRTAGVAIQNMIKSGTPPVHELAQVDRLTRFPTDFKEIRSATNYLKEPNMGRVVLVDPTRNVLLDFFVNAVDKLSRVHVRKLDSVEAALEHLRSVDPTLSE